MNLIMKYTIFALLLSMLIGCNNTSSGDFNKKDIKITIDYKKDYGDIFIISCEGNTKQINSIYDIPQICKDMSKDHDRISVTIVSKVMMTKDEEKKVRSILKENNIDVESFFIPVNIDD